MNRIRRVFAKCLVLLIILLLFYVMPNMFNISGLYDYNANQNEEIISDDFIFVREANPFIEFYFIPAFIDKYTQVFCKSINYDMPKFMFVLNGFYGGNDELEFAVSIKDIKIYDNSGNHIQTIDSLNTFLWWKPISDSDFSFDDWNNDGFLDISLFRIPGGSMGNRPTYYWLWDSQSQQFIENRELYALSENSFVSLDDYKIKASTKKDHSTLVDAYFKFENGKLIFLYEHRKSLIE